MSEIEDVAEKPDTTRRGRPKREQAELNALLLAACGRAGSRAVEEVKKYLDEGAEVNTSILQNRTPLWNAVFYNYQNSHDIIKLLLQYGAALEICDIDGETPLWRAAAEENEENLKLLLESGAKINAKDNRGTSVVMEAIIKGCRWAVVELLLGAGADMEQPNNTGETLLCVVAGRGDEDKGELLQALLDRGANVNRQDNDGMSVMHKAVSVSAPSMVRRLLEAGADPKVTDNHGRTALWLAVEREDKECSAELLKGGATIRVRDENDIEMHLKAARMGVLSYLESLLPECRELFESTVEVEETMLSCVLSSRNEDCVRFMLGLKPTVELPTIDGSSIIHQAAKFGSVAALRYLLESKSDTISMDLKDDDGRTPLWLALSSRDEACIDLLSKQKPDIKIRHHEEGSMLHQAARYGHGKIVELLIDKDFAIEDIDADGHTPLWLAADFGDEDCVRALLNRKVNTDAQDNSKVSVLHQAVKKDNQSIVKLLLDGFEDPKGSKDKALEGKEPAARAGRSASTYRRPNVNTKDVIAESPLSSAFENKSYEIAKLLLEAGADIEAMDLTGATCLWNATSRADGAAIELLVRAKANINSKNSSKISILHEAVRSGSLNVVKFLLCETNKVGNSDADIDSTTGETPAVQALDMDMESKVRSAKTTAHSQSSGAASDHMRPDVNTKDEDGMSPLLSAVNNKSTDIVKILLKHRAKFDAVDSMGDSELGIAAYYGSAEIAELLLKAGSDIQKPNDSRKSPLHWAALIRDSIEVWELLLDYGADIMAVDAYGETPIHYAVKLDVVSYIESLEASLIKPSRRQNASRRKARPTFNLQTQFGDGGTILHIAAARDSLRVIEYLLTRNVHVSAIDERGRTALHNIVDAHSLAGVRLLLPRMDAAAVGIMDKAGNTALHLACRHQSADIVKEFLAAEKSPMSRDTAALKNAKNETPISIAAQNESVEGLQLLVNYEADIRYTDKDESGRIWAIMEDPSHDVKSIGRLLDNEDSWKSRNEPIGEHLDGEDDGLNSHNGNRAKTLYWAARSGYQPLVEKILKLPETPESDLGEALYWAAVGGQRRIIKYIFDEYRKRIDSKSKAATQGDNKVAEDSSDYEARESSDDDADDHTDATADGGTDESADESVDETAESAADSESFQNASNPLSAKVSGRAVQAAARNGHEKTAQQLIKLLIEMNNERFSRGDYDESETRTWTPLHWAVKFKLSDVVDIVRNLLMNGADPENVPVGGISAIHLVVSLKKDFRRDRELEKHKTIVGLLHSPLRLPPKPIPLREPAANHSREARDISKNLYANIVDFYTAQGRFFTLESKSPILDIIYKQTQGPDKKMDLAKKNWQLRDIVLEGRLRWIHLPANNWIWAEDLMSRIATESGMSASEYTRINKFVEVNKREHTGNPQRRFMYPSLTFESKEFHSGEGVNIPRLQAEAKRRKDLLKKKSERQAEKDVGAETGVKPSTDHDQENPNDKNRGKGKGGDTAAEGKDPNVTDLGRVPEDVIQARAGEKPKISRKEPNDKPRAEEKGIWSHLGGSRLSLCIPYVTLQTVRSHRALRQAIRLAEAVLTLQEESYEKGTLRRENTDPQSLRENNTSHGGTGPDEQGRKKNKLRRQARKEILESDMANGLLLLEDTRNEVEETLKALGHYQASDKRKDKQDKMNCPDSRLAVLRKSRPEMSHFDLMVKMAADNIKDGSQEWKSQLEKLLKLKEVHEEVVGFEKSLTSFACASVKELRQMTQDPNSVSDSDQKSLDGWLLELLNFHKGMRRRKSMCSSHKILEWLERFFDAVEILQQRPKGEATPSTLVSVHNELLEFYLNPINKAGLHPSRTLDQYYYTALEDTSRRDLDQVVRRYQAKKREAKKKVGSFETGLGSPLDRIAAMRAERIEKAKSKTCEGDNGWEDDPDAQIAMVDQLWLWVIDDGTVITCFPKSWGSESRDESMVDLLDTIRKHIHADRRPQISSIYHLATIITSLCVGYVEHCRAKLKDGLDSREGFLSMFGSSVGIVTDEEVKCFETFKMNLNTPGDEAFHLDLSKEITLLEEIKDIRDELNVLRSIFEDQRALLGKLLNLIAVPQPAGSMANKPDAILGYYQERSDIDLRIEKVEKMDTDAKKTYDSINHLLDLKQKSANLHEAIQATKLSTQGAIQAEKAGIEAKEAVKQGRTILVFTLVTIVFLPLSFLTSLYALNVESFPHRGNDIVYPTSWIYPRIFGTSAAIVIPSIAGAIYINEILDKYKGNIRPWTVKRLERLMVLSGLVKLWKYVKSGKSHEPSAGGDQSPRKSEGTLPATPTPSQLEAQQNGSKSK